VNIVAPAIQAHPADTGVGSDACLAGKRRGPGSVAEGIESAAELEALRALGCRHVQGYVVSRPLPGGRLPGFLGWERSERRHTTSDRRAALPQARTPQDTDVKAGR
jgi:EAL domain-containing protein (putative c-di-GMP-specific phosphodiesterase class I)